MAEDAEEKTSSPQDASGEILNPGGSDQKSTDPVAAVPPHSPTLATAAGGLPNISLSIWPPSRRTRDAVISRLIENLSTRSILSNRYGVLSADEASATATRVEQEAFDAAAAAAADCPADSIEVGVELLQIYSKAISTRVLESVKARGSFPSPLSTVEDPPLGNAAIPAATDAAAPVTGSGKEVSSVESESVQA